MGNLGCVAHAREDNNQPLFIPILFIYILFILYYAIQCKEENIMTPKEMEKKIKKDGWYFVNAEGSHHHYKHPTKKGKVTIPFHPKPKDLDQWTVHRILRQAGLK